MNHKKAKSVKSAATIQTELSYVKNLLKRKNLTDSQQAELYGAQQALAWVLNENAAAPGRAAVDDTATVQRGSE